MGLRKKIFMCGAVVFLLPFIYGWTVSTTKTAPDIVRALAYVKPPCDNMQHPLDAAQEIAYAIQQAVEVNPEATIFLMPESSYPFPLNKKEEMVQLWNDFALPEGGTLLIGSQRKEEGGLYNSLFHIKEGRIINYYDKLLCMFLTERKNIAWDTGNYLNNLFLRNKEGFTKSTNKRSPFSVADNSFLPYICSDFFFSTQAFIDDDKIPLLVAANDAWFSATPYLQRLMLLFARFKAQEWQRSILYVSHTCACWIDVHGRVHQVL